MKYARILALLDGRHYPRVLELRCGAGTLTWHLASLADYVLALDIASGAIDRAQALWTGPATVDFRQANIMDYNPHAEGPWDLVVLSDIMYYLGWLYPFFDINWFSSQLFTATRVGGHCLYANAMGSFGDMLLLPWTIRSYRDVLHNVGYSLTDLPPCFEQTTPCNALGSLLVCSREGVEVSAYMWRKLLAGGKGVPSASRIAF